MQTTDGWQIVAGHIRERIAAKEAELLNMPVDRVDLDWVKSIKIERNALLSILRFIGNQIEAGEIAAKEQTKAR